MRSRRRRIKQELYILRKIKNKLPVQLARIAELKEELKENPPIIKVKKVYSSDQSAADDYLDYLSDQW